jgi:hypothetical protein
MVSSAFAQSSLPACQDSDFTRWTNCVGTFTYTDGSKYIGEYKGGKPNGQGIYVYSNGSKYVGGLQDDKFNGQGIWYKPDGSVFVSGDFSNNQLVRSIALDTNRFPFNAPTQTASAQPSTAERVQLAAAAQSQLPPCQGSDVSRWTNCFGTQTVFYGKYVGEFKDGNPNGLGTFTAPSGAEYVGEFKEGKRDGQGTRTDANGDKYVGGFKNDYPTGQGTSTLANGEKYVGEFKDNQSHGQGIWYRADGTIIRSGQWVRGVQVQSFAIDTNRFPFKAPIETAQSSRAETDRINAEAQAARQQELEQRLAAQAAEAEAAKRRQQDLEAQLAALQSTAQALPTAVRIRNAHALVIGNAAYPGSNRLDNTINDANAISQKLRSMGFTVTTVKDTNRQQLVQAMSQFKRTAASAELSLFFYAGHGVQIFGTNYILPTDVDQNDVAQATIQGVSLNSVVENFLPGKTKLVFLDACRDNPLQRSGDRSVSKGLAPISVAQGTLISYATKDGQTASDGAGAKNSPFTQALLQHLDDPADIAVVLRKVREKVMLATAGKQQPWEYGSLTGGELVLSKIKGGR